MMHKDGKLVCETVGAVARDSFGHAQLGGVAATLANILKEETGYKTRAVELSLMQRCAAHLASKTDVEGANFASLSGVKVIASAHASSVDELRRKPTFNTLFDNKIFDYAVILSDRLGLGTVEKVINL